MSYSSDSAAAQLLLLKKKKKNKQLFPYLSFLCQTAVCFGNFYPTMALWQTWWGIQMRYENKPGLEPLKKANVKPTSCGIKTTAQAIILSCAVKSNRWGL